MSRVFMQKPGNLATILLVASYVACVNKPPEPVTENPFDTNNPDYTPPNVTITNIPGDTLTQDSITFSWEGNDHISETRYYLKGRDLDWSIWDTSYSCTYKYLDEGKYNFYIQGRYPTDAMDTDSIEFTVDAVNGPALLIKPYYTQASPGDTIALELWAEEVTDLMAVSSVLLIDTSCLSLIRVEEGSFFQSNSGQTVFFNSCEAGSLFIDIGTTKGGLSGVTGSGAIAKISYIVNKTTEAYISFNTSNTKLRDINQNSITLNKSRPGIIIIK